MKTNPIEYLFRLNALDRVKFMLIRNYQNQNGEVSNYNLIAAFEYGKAVQKDIKRLQTVKYGYPLKEIARQELLTSLVNNQNLETKSNQSKAQQDAYVKLGANSRIHLETKTIFVWAFLRRKTILVTGNYPMSNKQEKTLLKEMIKKELRLSTPNFRQFKLSEIHESRVQNQTLEIGF